MVSEKIHFSRLKYLYFVGSNSQEILNTILVIMGRRSWMWNEETVLQPTSRILRGRGLIFIALWRTAWCHGVQKASSNLINFKHSYNLTEWQELYVPFVYLPIHTTLPIISLKGFYICGKQLWLRMMRKETGFKEQKRKEGEKKDEKMSLNTGS